MKAITTYLQQFRWPLVAGTAGLLLVTMFMSCSQKQPISFVASLEGVKSEKVVELSKIHIDSIAEHNPTILTTEIRTIVETLEARGDHKAAIQVAAYTYGIDANENPEIAERLLRSTLLPGKSAPPIIGNNRLPLSASHYGKQTILFFYESRCRSCQSMISAIIERYDQIDAAEISVITISSDRERELFEEYSQKFPWADKLCDFKNYESPNFVNYGVANTPTIFLLEVGKVKNQYSTSEEIMDLLLKQTINESNAATYQIR